MIEVPTNNPAETLALGRRLAAMLRAGDVVLLAGKLGAGKTLLASGIGEGLGVEEQLTSPSFILARSHEGFVPVVHADVYRLGSSAEFEDLDLPEQARDGVLLIEWGDVVAQGVPESHLLVEIDIAGESERVFRFLPSGSWSTRPLGELLQ
ncbi:MAG: tRNA (adenosine(37)-N6)-threonylcarbamoyltransferase complex ATPase subunit type 1 TsaE [bacterium]|nr:tRNA (adenosine(37)-N6)-threonylcarbamoyltransferase complex ATPase subunit type 1 TsaE [bacterium]